MPGVNGVETSAFPNISTGIYGFPKPRAAQIAVMTVKEFLGKNDRVKEVVFVCFDEENWEIYQGDVEVKATSWINLALYPRYFTAEVHGKMTTFDSTTKL